jgi:hypothetical protein
VSLTAHFTLEPVAARIVLRRVAGMHRPDRGELTSPDTKNIREGLAFAAWRSEECEVTLAGA